MCIRDSDKLESIEFKELEFIKGRVFIYFNSILKEVFFPKLIQVDEGTGFYDNLILKKINIPELRHTEGLYILRNSKFENLSGLKNLERDKTRAVQIDYNRMQSPSDLFQNINFAIFQIKINDPNENNLDWLSNLPLGTFINIESKLELSDFCILKDAVDLNATNKLVIKNSISSQVYVGSVLFNECQ